MAKLDRKFFGILRKAKDHTIVPDDQWMLFLAKDNAFAEMVQQYPDICERMGADPVQVQSARDIVARINAWRAANQDLLKVPDAAGERMLIEREAEHG